MGDREEKVEKKESLFKRYCGDCWAWCACCNGEEKEREEPAKKDFKYENWKDLTDSKADKTLADAKAASDKARKALEASETTKEGKEEPKDPLFVPGSTSDEQYALSQDIRETGKKEEGEDEKTSEGENDDSERSIVAKEADQKKYKKADQKHEKSDEGTTKEDKTDEKMPKEDKVEEKMPNVEMKSVDESAKGVFDEKNKDGKNNKKKEKKDSLSSSPKQSSEDTKSEGTSDINVDSDDLNVVEASYPLDESAKEDGNEEAKNESVEKEKKNPKEDFKDTNEPNDKIRRETGEAKSPKKEKARNKSVMGKLFGLN